VFLLIDRVVVYYDYMARVMAAEDYVAGHVEDLRWMPLSLWHVLLFVLSSFVAHRYFARRVGSPFLLWQLVGLAALCAWGLTLTTVLVMDELMHPGISSLERLMNVADLRYVAKFVATVLASNVVYASFIQSAARQYAEIGAGSEQERPRAALDTAAPAGV
jgi:hypothetical protein